MYGTYRIITADVLDGLRQLDDGLCRCCVTSPPYWGLRDYGQDGQLGLEPTPDEYVAKLVVVFREVRRVLADDGTVWLNLGDSYAGGGRNSGNSLQNTIAKQLTQIHSMNSGPQPIPSGLKAKDLVGIPWRVAFALQADGWYLRQDIIWHKPNPMPESVRDRCTKAHEYIFLLSKKARYYYDGEAIADRLQTTPHAPGNRADKDAGHLRNDVGTDRMGAVWGNANGTRNARSVWVWTIATQPYPEAHFATFPPELPERCIKAGSAPGDTVLDPFCGSGTTLGVACQLGRDAIGIELSPAYVELAHRRIGSMLRPNTNRTETVNGQTLWAMSS